MSLPILTVTLKYEQDVVAARQRARQLAARLGFDTQDQTRIATAVSEIARNAFDYAGGGSVEFWVEGETTPQVFLARVSDRGPGIADVRRVLEGHYRSATGLGLGLAGARRLVDRFQIDSSQRAGTTVWLRKVFPRTAPLVTPARLAPILDELARAKPSNLLQQVMQQNQELLGVLDELRARQEELSRLNRELEDTNRGVVALYAELDEKADHLRRADELKSRFLSNMSHEFRTPVNSIIALARLLLDRIDGALTAEQEKQVAFIRKAAEELSELVNDLLDLAKVEAGKIVVRPAEFEVAKLFGALRGMLRPLLVGESVQLVFDEPQAIPPAYTDEGKVSQILRNFISNALKFTERGEVRVSATLTPDRNTLVFAVADTGIGIAPGDQARIFEEFTQVDHPVQRRVKGTGLGLPLSKRLAELLGGRIAVRSELGVGSTFSLAIPLVYEAPSRGSDVEVAWEPDPLRTPVLVVEDSVEAVLTYEKLLKGSGYQVIPARSLREARDALRQARPRGVILDILLKGEDTWDFLAEIKRNEVTLPVLVVTHVEDVHKAMALGADAYCLKPVERRWLLEKLAALTGREPERRILIIDDEEVSRYLLRQSLADPRYTVAEAAGGLEGLRRAREERPDVIFLDLVMPGVSGFEVLERLKADPATAGIPVVVVTSKVLDGEERTRLAARAVSVLSKEARSREAAVASLHEALARAGVT